MTSSKGLKGSDNYIWWEKDHLGRGATASVFKCRNKRTGDLHAVKVFTPHHHNQPPDFQRREFEILQKLKHPNIVALLAVEEESPAASIPPPQVIIMEYCDGGSLYSILDDPVNAFGLAEEEFLLFLDHISQGMKYLRSQNVVHRDIKPGNIMKRITPDGLSVYKLTDFGAARELSGQDDRFTSMYGTEEYLHPDMYQRAVLKRPFGASFNANVDLWSVGATIYHVATGSLPFRPHGGRRSRDVMYQILNGKKKGDISGIQEKESGPIVYSRELPNTSSLSWGLRKLITPILAGLLECNALDCWSFERFFSEVSSIISRKVITVFNTSQSELLRINCCRNQTRSHLEDLLFEQTNIPQRDQVMIVENTLLEDFVRDTQTIENYPPTSYEQPIFLYHSAENLPPNPSIKANIPKIPRFSSRYDLDADYSLAKSCAGITHYINRKVKLFIHCQTLIEKAVSLYEKYLMRCVIQACTSIEHNIQTAEQVCERFMFMKNLAMLPHMDQRKPGFLQEVPELQQTYDDIHRLIRELKKHSTEYKVKLVENKELSGKWHKAYGCRPEDACLSKCGTFNQHVNQCKQDFERDKKARHLPYNEEQIHKFEKNKMSENCTKAMSLVEDHCFDSMRRMLQFFMQWYLMSYKIKLKCNKLEGKMTKLHDIHTHMARRLSESHTALQRDISTASMSHPSTHTLRTLFGSSRSSSGHGSMADDLEEILEENQCDLNDIDGRLLSDSSSHIMNLIDR